MSTLEVRLQTENARYFLDIRNSGVLHIARIDDCGERVEFEVPATELNTLAELLKSAQSAHSVAAVRLSQDPPPQNPPRFAEIRQKHPRAYLPWEAAEDEKLKQLLQSGHTIAQIANQLQRQPSAIRTRIEKLY